MTFSFPDTCRFFNCACHLKIIMTRELDHAMNKIPKQYNCANAFSLYLFPI